VSPVFLNPDGPPNFPDPLHADGDLIAIGGELTPDTLLTAYGNGIFPWFGPDEPVLWWSPDPRTVLQAEQLHISRSLRRRLRRGDFELTWNHAFQEVMKGCGKSREDGTWITQSMLLAYTKLHELGHAHSLEVWEDGALAGGVYGVQRGGLFAAESKFHTRRDASKIALAACWSNLATAGIEVFDVQFQTPHLATMGAEEWSRKHYLREVTRVRNKSVDLANLSPIIPQLD
jgi:leucyl/phenylalanyl-tRNA--protein transferase